MMETLTATFKVVTPMFMSGADQTKAELRVPSIKGALRFWWRALAWTKYEGDLPAIHRAEAKLFGSANQNVGQSKVLMKLCVEHLRVKPVGTVLKDGKMTVGEGARYLGYGVMEAFGNKQTQAGQLTRPCLEHPFSFSLHLIIHKKIEEKEKGVLVEALKLMGLVGGVGSKARKGYGSLMLTRLVSNLNGEMTESVSSLDELCKQLQNFKPANNKVCQADYTALSRDTRFLVLTNTGSSALSLLNKLGREELFYRSWGNQGKVLGRTSEKNFTDDHDIMHAVAHHPGYKGNDYPKRVAFGLPHNYFFSSSKKLANVTAVDGRDSKIERRASPLFIHIHEIGDEYVAILSFIPSTFLPEDSQIHMHSKGGADNKAPIDQNMIWQPVHNFLDRLKNKKEQKPFVRVEAFEKVIEVREGGL